MQVDGRSPKLFYLAVCFLVELTATGFVIANIAEEYPTRLDISTATPNTTMVPGYSCFFQASTCLYHQEPRINLKSMTTHRLLADLIYSTGIGSETLHCLRIYGFDPFDMVQVHKKRKKSVWCLVLPFGS